MFPDSYSIRSATPEDAPTIAFQLGQMFVDMGSLTLEGAAEQQEVWTQWFGEAVSSGEYVAFMVEQAGQVAAGVGVMFLPKIPTTKDPMLHKAHILNMYVAPEHRRKGLAEALMHAVLQEARQRGLRSVSLNAAPMGQRIYERLGFMESTSPEMRLTLEPQA